MLQILLQQQLVHWYQKRHPRIATEIDNTPKQLETDQALTQLVEQILIPIATTFGEITITYGFTSAALKSYIQKNSPSQTAPQLDQHASYELNQKGRPICSRLGAACDFKVKGYEQRMDLIARYITEHLSYDRMYFYSATNALHVSIGPDHSRMVQYMKLSGQGHFVPWKRASGAKAIAFFDQE